MEQAVERVKQLAGLAGMETALDDLDSAATGMIQQQQLSERIPLARMAEPAEIASAALFLVSDAASYVTGHTLLVDGGLLA